MRLDLDREVTDKQSFDLNLNVLEAQRKEREMRFNQRSELYKTIYHCRVFVVLGLAYLIPLGISFLLVPKKADADKENKKAISSPISITSSVNTEEVVIPREVLLIEKQKRKKETTVKHIKTISEDSLHQFGFETASSGIDWDSYISKDFLGELSIESALSEEKLSKATEDIKKLLTDGTMKAEQLFEAAKAKANEPVKTPQEMAEDAITDHLAKKEEQLKETLRDSIGPIGSLPSLERRAQANLKRALNRYK